MTLRRRSWVIGRGVDTFSICDQMALASHNPTQIGRTFWPSLSRKMMIGMFVTGSTIRPLIVISICMAPTFLPGRESDALSTVTRLLPAIGLPTSGHVSIRRAPHTLVRPCALDRDANRPARSTPQPREG